MSCVKRGFVAFRQLVTFNTHVHNSIYVCDFPFGAFLNCELLTLIYPWGRESEREREIIISLMIQWFTVAVLCLPSFTGTC